MPLFRRRRDGSDDSTDFDEADVAGDQTLDEQANAGTTRPHGPWDAGDVNDDVQRLDLGALQVPVPEGTEVRLDVQDDQVVAATIVDGRSAIQIHAFAAPRSEGIWEDVRREIADSLNSSGGSAEEVDGPFGRELRARIPLPPEAQQPGMQSPTQPARFVGVDGPRWFLRGLVTGAAATDPQQAGALENAFRNVVVVRGPEAMAPRDLLTLRLPREAVQQMGQAVPEDEQQQRPTLDMLERGPEITETR